jgi:cytidine deaminase|tara:strand:+ start:1757 stop:2740 length:984 start_codon:yes stop_codon:yes gene_type:complete
MPTADDDIIARVVEDAVERCDFVISADAVSRAQSELSCDDVERILLRLAQSVSRYARPPTSRFHVGAAAMGASGRVYLGVNVEIHAVPLNHSIHAEQFSLVTAGANEERKILAIATTEAPCGHCRQFMNELRDAENLRCVTESWRWPLRELLPHAFGPMDLLSPEDEGRLLLEDQGGVGTRWGDERATVAHGDGLVGAMACSTPRAVVDVLGRDETWRALARGCHRALAFSYAPYSRSRAGIAVRTTCGEEFLGWSLECAAYNPSMSPLQVVIARMVAQGKDLSTIEYAVLSEFHDARVKYDCTVRLALAKIAPKAGLVVLNYHRDE